ncbi:MAG: TetR/AcrR family transcriptional regulator [Limisphaerales bacterium]
MNPSPPKRGSFRGEILQAAEWVVCQQGAGHLTLDAVAERAGVSKGGLLYHFPTKESLLKELLSSLLERFDADREVAGRSQDCAGQKASDLKAFVKAGFQETPDRRQVCAALVAAGANDPRLLAPVREWHASHFRELSEGKRHPLRVLLLMLAVDGLWFNELLNTSAFSPEMKEALRGELFRFAESAL